MKLTDLTGVFTYSRLRSKGYTENQIGKAIRVGFLRERKGILTVDRRKRPQLNEILDDVLPGTMVARVIDGVIQKMQVVRDEGRELAVIDPGHPDRIINIPKDDTADAEMDAETEEPVVSPVGSTIPTTESRFHQPGPMSTPESEGIELEYNALVDEFGGKPLEEGGARKGLDLQNWLGVGRRLMEGKQVYTVDDEDVDKDNPYSVGEAYEDYENGDENGDGDGTEFLDRVQELLEDHPIRIIVDQDEFNRAGDEIKFMRWDGNYADADARDRPGDTFFRGVTTNPGVHGDDIWSISWLESSIENGSIDHPNLGVLERAMYYFYNEDEDDDVWEDNTRAKVLRTLRALHHKLQSLGPGPTFERIQGRIQALMQQWRISEDEYLRFRESIQESIRPRELPEELREQYPALAKQARNGLDGESAVCMYFPSFAENDEGKLAVVRESDIEQEMAQGALVVNESQR